MAETSNSDDQENIPPVPALDVIIQEHLLNQPTSHQARLWLTASAQQAAISNQQTKLLPLPAPEDHLLPILTKEGISGATVTDQEAQALAQQTPAPTLQDLATAPAPQLAQTSDPVGRTDPALAASEYITPQPHLSNLLLEFTSPTQEINKLKNITNLSQEDESNIMKFLLTPNKLDPWNIKAPGFKLKAKTRKKWVGKLIPV